MQDNQNESSEDKKPDVNTTQNEVPNTTTLPTVTPSAPSDTTTEPSVTVVPIQPTMNASVASATYPEPEKGFLSTFSLPKNNESEAFSGGSMMLYVTVFAISLVLILSIVVSLSGLLELLFNHLGSTKNESSAASYFGLDSYELKIMLWLVSNLVISTVIYVLTILYLRKYQALELNSFSTKVYGIVYGGFLTIIGLATISSFGNFVYSCLVPLVPKGAYDVAGVQWWVGIIQALLTTLLLGFVMFYYVKKAKSSERLL